MRSEIIEKAIQIQKEQEDSKQSDSQNPIISEFVDTSYKKLRPLEGLKFELNKFGENIVAVLHVQKEDNEIALCFDCERKTYAQINVYIKKRWSILGARKKQSYYYGIETKDGFTFFTDKKAKGSKISESLRHVDIHYSDKDKLYEDIKNELALFLQIPETSKI